MYNMKFVEGIVLSRIFKTTVIKGFDIMRYIVIFSGLWLWTMYILGASKMIARAWHSGIGNKMAIGLFAAIFVLVLVCIIKLKFGRGISDFSWKKYFKLFAKRYHMNRVDIGVLVVITLAGGLIRLAGYDWGITSIFQPDEGKLVMPALDMAITKSPYQSSFYYPSQILSKFVAVCIFFYGKYKSIELNYFLPEPYFIFRIFTAAVGTATIPVCFLIGNYFKRHLGTILAILVSTYPLYTAMAKQVTGDVSVFFFLSLVMLFSIRYMEEREPVFLVVMSLGAALATLEKWHGAVGIGYTGLVVLLNGKQIRKVFHDGILTIVAYISWLFLLCPNMIFNIKTAIVDGFINIAVYDGSEGLPYFSMLVNYGVFGIKRQGGILYVLLIVFGLLLVLRHFTKSYLILLMGVLKTLILCLLNRQFARWGLELFFCELFLASIGIWEIANMVNVKWRVVSYILFFIVTIDFTSGSMVYVLSALFSENDTRLVQEKECLSAGITPDNSVSAYYTGFSPGCVNSKYGTFRQVFSDFFDVEGGKSARRSENIKYAIINASDIREPELIEAIRKDGVRIFAYEARYCDIFRKTFTEDTPTFFDDFRLICQNMHVSYDLYKGALSGSDIEVYSVENIPLVFR